MIIKEERISIVDKGDNLNIFRRFYKTPLDLQPLKIESYIKKFSKEHFRLCKWYKINPFTNRFFYVTIQEKDLLDIGASFRITQKEINKYINKEYPKQMFLQPNLDRLIKEIPKESLSVEFLWDTYILDTLQSLLDRDVNKDYRETI